VLCVRQATPMTLTSITLRITIMIIERVGGPASKQRSVRPHCASSRDAALANHKPTRHCDSDAGLDNGKFASFEDDATGHQHPKLVEVQMPPFSGT